MDCLSFLTPSSTISEKAPRKPLEDEQSNLNGRTIAYGGSGRLLPNLEPETVRNIKSRFLQVPYQRAVTDTFREIEQDPPKHRKKPSPVARLSVPKILDRTWYWDKPIKDTLKFSRWQYGNDFYEDKFDLGYGRIKETLANYEWGSTNVSSAIYAKISGKLVYLIEPDWHQNYFNALSWGNDPSDNLLLTSRNHRLWVYDVDQRKVVIDRETITAPHCIDRSHECIAVGTDLSVLLVDSRAEKIQHKLGEGELSRVCRVKLTNDKNYLASGDNSCNFRLWDIRRIDSPLIKYKFKGACKAIALSPKQPDLHVAVGTGLEDGRLAVFSKNSAEPRIITEKAGQLSGLIWSKSGALIGSDRYGSRIVAYDAYSGTKIGSANVPSYPLTLVSDRFEPTLSFASCDSRIRKMNLPTTVKERKAPPLKKPKLKSTALNLVR